MNYCLHFEAEAEHLEQVGHYETLRPGLGARYLDDFESTMARICDAPQRFRIEVQPGIRIASPATKVVVPRDESVRVGTLFGAFSGRLD